MRPGGSAVLRPCEAGPVANWNKGTFWTADFTDYTAEGEYRVEAEGPGGCVRSHPFRISGKVLTMRMISAVGYYFKAQRDSGEWLAADRALPFAGPREGSWTPTAAGTTPPATTASTMPWR